LEFTKPSRISILIEARENTLSMEVEDDGRAGTQADLALMGLDLMHSHARRISGSLVIKQTSNGTRMTCTVPFLRQSRSPQPAG
jgi:signal transduction histidine kinase